MYSIRKLIDKTFINVDGLSEVWIIAWPTVLTMSSYTIKQFTDKLMVGQLGANEIAAQGTAGLLAFIPISLFAGLLPSINTWTSQHLGSKKPWKGAAYCFNGMWMSLAIWICVFLPLVFIFPFILSFVHLGQSDAKALIPLEIEYGSILLAFGGIHLFERCIAQYFFGMHRPIVVTLGTIAGNIVNVIASYILIFGESGIPSLGMPGIQGTPALGLTGAAIGTAIGTLVELVIPLAVMFSKKSRNKLRVHFFWKPNFTKVKDIIRLGWPKSLQWTNDIITWAIFMIVLTGSFGKNSLAAGYIVLGYMHLSFMPALGFNIAVNSLVAKYCGANQYDLAQNRCRIGVLISIVYMSFCAVLFIIFRESAIDIFIAPNTSQSEKAEILQIGTSLMILAALYQTLDALGIVYSGGLNGSGDVVYIGVLTTVLAWVILILGGFMFVKFFPSLGPIGPWIAAAIYISLYGICAMIRFEKGKWKNIKLVNKIS